MPTSGFVAIVGRPNAGKSTLLNRLVGTKVAIVSDKPQTTRTRILGVRNYSEGQAVFLDTPGIHKPSHRMNARMVRAAVDAMGEADFIVLVADARLPVGGGDRFVLRLISRSGMPAALALNKVDAMAKENLLPLIDWYSRQHPFTDVVPISALTGDGVDRLERIIIEHLPEGEPLYPEDFLTDQAERTLVAEIVREKILDHTRDELPYTTAVIVDRFEEPQDDRPMRLFCSILVESDSQKVIVVGRRGDMIKRIGTEARHDIEAFFGTRVYLDLHVKVREGWREDARILEDLGLGGKS